MKGRADTQKEQNPSMELGKGRANKEGIGIIPSNPTRDGTVRGVYAEV